MTTELQQNRYDSIMRRVGDLKGPGSKVSEVLAELFPVVDLERVPGELLILGGTDICAGNVGITAGAGVNANIQLFNPPDSGKVIAVTSFVATVSVDQQIRWGVNNVALANLNDSQLFRDTRRPFNSLPSGQLRSQNFAGFPVVFGSARLLASTSLVYTDENGVAVLSPGFGFSVAAATVATVLEGTFYWRERVAEPSELNV